MNTHRTLAVNDLLIHCGGGGNAGVVPKVMHSAWVAGALASKFWWKNTPATAVWRGKTLESKGKQTLLGVAHKKQNGALISAVQLSDFAWWLAGGSESQSTGLPGI
jgi:hypothetical protein